MNGLMKKVTAMILSVLMTIVGCVGNGIPVQAAETSQNFVDVRVYNAPLRVGPEKSADAIAYTYDGRVLTVVDEITNQYGNLWYEVAWEAVPGDGTTAYIFSGNVSEHSHAYACQEVEGIEFSFCKCGDVYIEESSYMEISMANTLVLGASATAGATSMADGPLPVGDLIGIILLAGAWCLDYTGAIPTDLQKITTDADFMDYLKDNAEICTNENFRMVKRVNGLLQVIGNSCLNIPQAYIYSRYCKGDVWTRDYATALECAAFNGTYFGPEVDKNAEGYYYHFHYGNDHTDCVGGHIFYGAGQFTGCLPTGL